VEQAIRATEWHYEEEFCEKTLEQEILAKGWSMDYVYLDSRKNRYTKE